MKTALRGCSKSKRVEEEVRLNCRTPKVYSVLGYDVNNTKGRIAGDSVRENRERTWGLVRLGQGKILETV